MNPNRYSISLRIFHPSINPQGISEALSLKPEHSKKAGDPRTTPKGTPFEGLNRETYWCAELSKGAWPGKSLSVAIEEAIVRLTPHRILFRRIHAEGGRSEFFVGWFFEGMGGDEFESALLAKLADLQIGLSLNFYPPDQPQAGI